MKLSYSLMLLGSLALAGCGGGGSGSEEKQPTVTPPTTPTASLSVSLANDQLNFNENSSGEIAVTIDYNGSDTVEASFSSVSGSDALSMSYNNSTIFLTTGEVNSDQSISMTVTFKAGELSVEKTFTVNVADVPVVPDTLSMNAANTLSINENDTVTMPITIESSGIDAGDIELQWSTQANIESLATVELTDSMLTVNALEVTETSSFELLLTASAGALSAQQVVNVSITDVPPTPVLEVVLDTENSLEENSNTSIPVNISTLTNEPVDVQFSIPGDYVSLVSLEYSQGSIQVSAAAVEQTTNIPVTVLFVQGDLSVEETIQLQVIDSTPLIAGVVTYDRLGFNVGDETAADNYGLDPDNPVATPSRHVVVKLLDETGAAVAATTTDLSGTYEFSMVGTDLDKTYQVEVLAQLELDGQVDDGFKVIVKDQSTATELADQQVYGYRNDIFALTTGLNTQDIHLESGWDGIDKVFVQAQSQAQPFAILDSIYTGAAFLMAGEVEFNDSLEPLTVNWTQTPGHVEHINMGGAFYGGHDNRIYIGGEILSDELGPDAKPGAWDQHIIIHEFGHFYERKVVGRSDSRGGSHAFWNLATLPVAFSEGLANALAYAALDDWKRKSTPKAIYSGHSFDDLYAIAEGSVNGTMSGTTASGDPYSRPTYINSPFEEINNTYFVLSFIDPNKASTLRTTNLANEVGMKGLHRALVAAAEQPALTSAYSVAAQLKALYPDVVGEIDILGGKLDTVYNDMWGSGQTAIEHHQLWAEGIPLPEETYLPVYQPMTVGSSDTVCFNGGMPYWSKQRAGTVQYVRLTADKDGMVLVRVPETVDSNGNTHGFDVGVSYKGQIAEQSLLFPNGNLDELEFMAREGEEYVIRIFGKKFEEREYHVNDTVCTTVTVE